MDIVYLLFYPSWTRAVRHEGRNRSGEFEPDEIRCHPAIGSGPYWWLALIPMAVVAALVLARMLVPADI